MSQTSPTPFSGSAEAVGLGSARRLIDKYYDIAFSGSLSPQLHKSGSSSRFKMNSKDRTSEEESEGENFISTPTISRRIASSIGENDVETLMGPSVNRDLSLEFQQQKPAVKVEILDSAFLESYTNMQQTLQSDIGLYKASQDQFARDIEGLREILSTVDDKEDEESNNSWDSVDSEIDIDLNYKLTNYIKSNHDDRAKMQTISRVRNVVNTGLSLVNDEHIKGKNLKGIDKEFVERLSELVDAFTEN